MAKVFASAVDLLWAGIAATLIAAAALVTIVRLMLPEVSSQREAVAAWISDAIGRPAVIGQIEASWDGWAPRISVHDIALLDETGSTELVRFERAAIHIAPLGSILSGSLKPKSLIVSGVALALLRDEAGRFSVAGMPAPKSPVIKWLIQQDNFAVTEADLTIIDERAGQSFALSGLTLSIRNLNGAKLLTGFVDLPADIGGRLVIAFSAEGDPLGSDWDGDINFRLQDVNSNYVIEQLDWNGPPPPAAKIDLQAWTHWREARLEDLRFGLDVAASGGQQAPLLSAQGKVSRRQHGWRLDIVDLVLPELARSAGNARFSTAWRSRSGVLEAAAVRGYDLPLEALLAVAAGLGPVTPELREVLQQSRPSGVVREIEAALHRGDDDKVNHFANVALSRLSTNRQNLLPGITGMDVTLSLTTAGGELQFSNTDFKIDDDERLPQPLNIAGLNGGVNWHTSGAIVAVEFENLSADANGTQLVINGVLDDAFGDAAHADLDIALPHAHANRLHHLIPMGVLPPRGETWVRNVLKDGVITAGAILLRGPLAEFPFRQGQGVFALDFALDQAVIEYSPSWPAADLVRGHVAQRGPKVHMTVASANVMGAEVVAAEITMADVFARERFVHINGLARGPGTSAASIVMASPMRNGKAARLADIEIGGTIDVDLDMDIALFPDGPREVLGQTRFAGNRVYAPKLNVVLDEVKGTVSFTRGDWYGENLTAIFEGIPVGLVVNGGLDDPNYDSQIRMTGTPSASKSLELLGKYAPRIHHWLKDNRSLDALSGEVPWKAVLTVPTPVSDGPALPRRLTLESSLFGLASDLPWPFSKQAGERRPLTVDLDLRDGVAESTRIDYGDIIDVEVDARRSDDGRAEVERIEVLFGSVDPEFKGTPGGTVKGYIARLPLDEWTAFQRRPGEQTQGNAFGLGLKFDVQVAELELLGQQFDDIRLAGQRQEANWQVSVASSAMNGHIVVPRDFGNGTLKVELDQLRLVTAERNGEPAVTSTFDPRRLPALELAAESFIYNDIDLGQARISTERREHGLELKQMDFRGSSFELGATGQWTVVENTQNSRFKIKVASVTLGGLLDRFGYNVANIRDGKTTIDIDASWPGTPVDFSLAQMAGNFELHVSDGRLLDIDPGGGRLFGLLSLQSLPRRLTLDFDDLFRKGFAFDHIDGVFELENGNAYTNGLLMDGPSARIAISGRTGLTENDYDQHMTVTPALSSSLPVAAALFGPIGIGAGAVYFLGQKMFKAIPKRIDKLLSREYSITGSWGNPTVNRI